MHLLLRALGLTVASALAIPAAAWATDPASATVTLPPVNVMESVLNVQVEIDYAAVPNAAPWVEHMYVGVVKPGSRAEGAGLKTGMEIIAIQGTRVAHLQEGAVKQLLVQGVSDHVRLTVRRGWFGHAQQILLPVPPPGG